MCAGIRHITKCILHPQKIQQTMTRTTLGSEMACSQVQFSRSWAPSASPGVSCFFINIFAILGGFGDMILVYLPWMVPANCSIDQPWEAHLAYSLVLVMAAPLLGVNGAMTTSTKAPEIPVIQVGGAPGRLYSYFTTILGAADQYLDNNTAAMARACQFPLWPAMLAAYLVSLVLQALGASMMVWYYSNTGVGKALLMVFVTISGVNPDGFARHPDSIAAGKSLAITRFLTESIPQAVLQIMFAIHKSKSQTGLLMVCMSVIFSLLMAGKSCVAAIGPRKEARDANRFDRVVAT